MSTTIDIRRAVLDDAAALSAIGSETFTATFAHLYDPKDLSAFLESDHSVSVYQKTLADPQTAVWIALTDDQVIGYAVAAKTCGLPVDDMPERVGEVKRLYVLSSGQNAGTGARLMDEMIGWITDDGDRPIYLSVYKYNPGAQRFYARYGFEYLKEYKYMVGSQADPEYVYLRSAMTQKCLDGSGRP